MTGHYVDSGTNGNDWNKSMNVAKELHANTDTNCDGSVNIVDALLVAQYYVSLVSQFC